MAFTEFDPRYLPIGGFGGLGGNGSGGGVGVGGGVGLGGVGLGGDGVSGIRAFLLRNGSYCNCLP